MSTLLDTAKREDSDLFSSIEDRIEPMRKQSFLFKTFFRNARKYGQREILANAEMLGADYVTVEKWYSLDKREYTGMATFYRFRV